MKKICIIIMLLSLVIGTVHCGGSGSISSKNTSIVTITVGDTGQTASIQIVPETFFTRVATFFKHLKQSSALASIPSNVHKIVFTIAGPDMSTMTKEVFAAGQTQIRESFSVPNGKNRYFYVAAKNTSEQVLYQGNAQADLEGKPVHLFITMMALDTTPPTVISTDPSNNKTGVPITSAISITFSEIIDSSTFNSGTFSLTGNGLAVGGTISASGAVATITPSVNLAYSTVYTATITTGVADMAGNHMAANYTWIFTTAPAPDTTPPTVTGVSPGIDAKDVPVTSVITATFSEAVDPMSINGSTLFLMKTGDNTPISGTVTYAGMTATFIPAANLAYDTSYTATVTTGAKDPAGNFMTADYSWTFTTVPPPPPPTPPTVLSTNPTKDAVGVPAGTTISATFSREMYSLTINTSTFTVKRGTNPISGTVTYSNKTATFTPSSPLTLATSYTAMVAAGVKDIYGNSMTSDYSWSFTTAGPPLSVAPSSVSIYAYTNPDPYTTDNVHFTISGGTSPYTVTSSNTALIPNPVVVGSTFTVDPNSTCTNTAVTLTVRDAIGATSIATVTLQRPSPSFVASPGSICENDSTCSAGTETSTLALHGVSPFSITSGSTSVIPNSGTISGYTYLVDAVDNSIGGVSTNVLLTLTDNCGDVFDASLTVINQDIFVNVGTGSDTTGNGTSSTPFKTITKALSVTPGNEKIHVAAGTYNAAIGETFPINLAGKNGIFIECTSWPGGTVIQSAGGPVETAFFGGSNATISGCEIHAGATIPNAAISDNISSSETMTIDNCYIDGQGSGLNGVEISSNTHLKNSTIINFTQFGVVVSNSSPAIYNNLIEYNNTGIQIWNDAGAQQITYNSIRYNNAGIGISGGNPVINYNYIFCNNACDLRISSSIGISIDARFNSWDNSTVWVNSSGSCTGGVDVCYTAGTPGTPAPDTSGNTQVSGGCPLIIK